MISNFQRNRHFRKDSVNKIFTHVQEQKNALSPRHSAYIPPSVKSPLRITFILTDKKTQFSEAAFSSSWKEIQKSGFLWLRETLLSELLTIFALFNVTLFKTYFFS